MSIKLLSAAWDLEIGSTEKMVLMCLCDYANDDGNCWPSVATLARKCSKSERTVQAALKWLRDNAFFREEARAGTSTIYHLDPRKICTPAESAPPQKTSDTPAKSAPKPLGSTSNGLADAKPMRAIRRKGWPEIPNWLPAEPWNGFIQMRDRKRASPTPRAISLLIAKLDGLRAKGHDPGAILDISTERSWTGLFEPKDDHGRPHQNTERGLRGSRPDPALDMLIQAERELQAEAEREGQIIDFTPRAALPAYQSGRS